MSNYKGYKLEDNVKRKSNNMTESHYDAKVNYNAKRYTTSGSAQNDYMINKYAKNFKSEVREWTQEELDELNNKAA